MRLSLVLGGLLVATLIAVAIFGEREGGGPRPEQNVSMMDRLLCGLSGGCYWDEEGPMSAEYAAYATAMLYPQNPGFLVPPWAEPAPDPDRQAQLESLLSCTNEDLSEGSSYTWPTRNSLYWTEGAPPPPVMLERAEAGDADTLFDLGFGYLSGHSDLEDTQATEQGFAWMIRAAEHGHVMAHTELGAAYAFGYFGQNVDYPAARRHLSAAVEAGDPVAMLSLALLPPEQGQDLRQYAQARLELELRSAGLCHDEAIAHTIARLRSGRGLAPDPQMADRIARRVTGIEAIGEPQFVDKQALAEKAR